LARLIAPSKGGLHEEVFEREGHAHKIHFSRVEYVGDTNLASTVKQLFSLRNRHERSETYRRTRKWLQFLAELMGHKGR